LVRSLSLPLETPSSPSPTSSPFVQYGTQRLTGKVGYDHPWIGPLLSGEVVVTSTQGTNRSTHPTLSRPGR
jgi:hypothetical protein